MQAQRGQKDTLLTPFICKKKVRCTPFYREKSRRRLKKTPAHLAQNPLEQKFHQYGY